MPGLLDAMLRALRKNPAAAQRFASVLSGTLSPRRVVSPLGLLLVYLGK